MGRVMIAVGASVYSNLRPLSIRELIEYAVVQLDDPECMGARNLQSPGNSYGNRRRVHKYETSLAAL
jgi:hypothetical protein